MGRGGGESYFALFFAEVLYLLREREALCFSAALLAFFHVISALAVSQERSQSPFSWLAPSHFAGGPIALSNRLRAERRKLLQFSHMARQNYSGEKSDAKSSIEKIRRRKKKRRKLENSAAAATGEPSPEDAGATAAAEAAS